MIKKVVTLFFLLGNFLTLSLYKATAQEKKDTTNRHTNLSLSIKSNSQKGVEKTYFNVGLLSDIDQLKGVGIHLFSSIIRKNSTGLQMSVLANTFTGKYNGIMFSGGVNIATKRTIGLEFAFLMNINSSQSFIGQFAGLGNLATEMKGLQFAALTNMAVKEFKGLQLASAVNMVVKADKALQLSSVNICTDFIRGTQFGIYNYAENIKGVQVGLINLSREEMKGPQIGLINISKDTSAVKIGLVNVNIQTRMQMLTFIGNTTKINVGVRFLNRFHYSILGFGTHYRGLNEKFSGSIYYRTGLRYALLPKWWLSSDIGYVYIENFKDNEDNLQERMYALQLRGNLEYEFSKKLIFFASGGYSMGRYFKPHSKFENKPIVEMGVLLF